MFFGETPIFKRCSMIWYRMMDFPLQRTPVTIFISFNSIRSISSLEILHFCPSMFIGTSIISHHMFQSARIRIMSRFITINTHLIIRKLTVYSSICYYIELNAVHRHFSKKYRHFRLRKHENIS